MKLEKSKLVPLLEMMGYTTIGTTEVWKKQHEDNTKQIFWGVDFRKNEVFKWVGDHREYDVKGDSTFEELMILVKGQCGEPSKSAPSDATDQSASVEETEEEENTVDENDSVPDEPVDYDVVEPEELTHEEKLKVAEMVHENGYDKETAVGIVKGNVKQGNNSPATIPKGYVPKLNIEDVKMYLCPKATDQEAYVFLELCKARNLNPFTNEVYLIKYNEKDTAQAVVGKETFTRKAEQNPYFAGFEAGIIVRNEAGEMERRPGTFYIDGETLLGGWARVYRNDKEYPFTDEVALKEYVQVTRDGTPNKFWRTKPGTMIRKVAMCHALREAFPSEFGGLYDQSELDAVKEVSA
jgi:phage recombination protein Bet